jgi:tetratricopeptide (TPR) repeat protein
MKPPYASAASNVRMNRNRVLQLLAIGMGLCACAWGQTGDPELAEGLRRLEEGRTTLSDKALNDAREYFLKLTQKNSNSAIYSYELARVDQYRCNAADMRKDSKAAMAAMEAAISEALEAIKLNEASAEDHSLLADLYGRRIGLGGFMAGARFGPKIGAENKRALELDANDPRVLASVGRQYLMAPKMFGGDLDKAIANLQKSAERDPTADETFVWLAIAERKRGDTDAANKALDEALRLNPRSVFAQNTKAGK